jgi:hypothetical protein
MKPAVSAIETISSTYPIGLYALSIRERVGMGVRCMVRISPHPNPLPEGGENVRTSTSASQPQDYGSLSGLFGQNLPE